MRRKILFAVMALLTMTTGNIWAQGGTTTDGSTAYVVYDTENTTLHFLCAKAGDVTDSKISIAGKEIVLTADNSWSGDKVLKTGTGYSNSAGWSRSSSIYSNARRIVIHESFSVARPTSCYRWFYYLKNISAQNGTTTIEGIEHLNTSEVTNMGYMFYNCTSLTSLDLSKFNTEKVTDMSYMFSTCNNLPSLDLSKFNTEKVTDMRYMFCDCGGLTSLDLSKFNTEKVTDMSCMFSNCSGLTSLDLSKFNTSSVTDMSSMFYGCSKLTSLTFGENFNTEKVQKMNNMFRSCSGLTSLDLSNFNTSNVIVMECMFGYCSKLTSLDLSKLNTGKVTNMNYMFYGCSSLTSLDLRNFTTTSGTNMDFMFSGCNNLRLLDLSKATSLKFSDMVSSISNRPLTYVPTGTTADRENVVVGNECEHLVINYGATPNNQLLLSTPYGFTAKKITINRNFTQGKPYTLCLPFAVTNTATYGAFYKYSDYNDGKVKFTKVETTEANKPYLFVPSTTLGGSIVIDGETAVGVQTAETSEDGEFIGVYRKMTFTGEEASEGVCYGWTDNSDGKGEFRRAGNGASVDACRAYIKLSAASGGSSAPARLSIELDGGATAISTLSTAGSGADGGTDAPMYNLQGQRVSGSYKGVVIKNGKKMIVK